MEVTKPSHDELIISRADCNSGLWSWEGVSSPPGTKLPPDRSRIWRRSLLPMVTVLIIGFSTALIERPNAVKGQDRPTPTTDVIPPAAPPPPGAMPTPPPPAAMPQIHEIDPEIIRDVKALAEMVRWWQTRPTTPPPPKSTTRHYTKHQYRQEQPEREQPEQPAYYTGGCPPSICLPKSDNQ